MKNPKQVYSARIPEEIISAFKEQCKKLNIPHAYVIQEYMKKFVVMNIDKEPYESAILNNDLENNEEEERLASILDNDK